MSQLRPHVQRWGQAFGTVAGLGVPCALARGTDGGDDPAIARIALAALGNGPGFCTRFIVKAPGDAGLIDTLGAFGTGQRATTVFEPQGNRAVSATLRLAVLERDGFGLAPCGISPGPAPFVRFHTIGDGANLLCRKRRCQQRERRGQGDEFHGLASPIPPRASSWMRVCAKLSSGEMCVFARSYYLEAILAHV